MSDDHYHTKFVSFDSFVQEINEKKKKKKKKHWVVHNMAHPSGAGSAVAQW